MSNSKVIIITGSSSGFGKLAAESLAAKGHKVYATMRNVSSKNKAVAEELGAREHITVLDLDVTNDESVKSAVEQIENTEGKVDVLVNNAGGGGVGISESYDVEEVKQQFDVNVFGVFRVTKAVLPLMRKQKDGLVISISSIMGRFTAPFFAMYCSSKYALEGMAEAWRYEWKPIGVDSVIVEPGAFPTTKFGENMGSYSPEQAAIMAEYGEAAQIPQKFGEMLEGMVASGNYQKPEMVVDAIADLINMPKGDRPLRTIVDNHFDQPFTKLNEHTNELQKMALEGFQMSSLYH